MGLHCLVRYFCLIIYPLKQEIKQTIKFMSAEFQKKKLKKIVTPISYSELKEQRINSVDPDEVAHFELNCLQIQQFSFLEL